MCIIGTVATVAGVGRIGIVTVVTSIAIVGNRNVRSRERINRIVVKRRRCPRGLCVASSTIRRELSRCVVRIGGSRVVCVVTTVASVRCVRIVAVVASVAIIRNRYVRTYEWINRIVVKRRWRPGGFAVASRAIRRELGNCVVRSCGSRIIAVVTSVAGVRCGIVIPVVAGRAIVGNCRMCPV